jgi:hypothetical protein
MRFEMVNRDQRLLIDERDRLRRGEPDDDASNQPRPGRRRHCVDIGKAAAGIAHRLGDDVIERLDMGAGGDLRHHAAEGCMLAGLREHDVGQDFPALLADALDHRGRGLVTGGFDAKHDHPSILTRVSARHTAYLLSPPFDPSRRSCDMIMPYGPQPA